MFAQSQASTDVTARLMESQATAPRCQIRAHRPLTDWASGVSSSQVACVIRTWLGWLVVSIRDATFIVSPISVSAWRLCPRMPAARDPLRDRGGASLSP